MSKGGRQEVTFRDPATGSRININERNINDHDVELCKIVAPQYAHNFIQLEDKKKESTQLQEKSKGISLTSTSQPIGEPGSNEVPVKTVEQGSTEVKTSNDSQPKRGRPTKSKQD